MWKQRLQFHPLHGIPLLFKISKIKQKKKTLPTRRSIELLPMERGKEGKAIIW
jgi:hypothetical protein